MTSITKMMWNDTMKRIRDVGIALVVYTVLHIAGVHRVLAPDVEAIGVIIAIFGSIYAVIWAFTVFLIWQQFAGVESLNMQEASALDDLARFSVELQDEDKLRVVGAVRAYLRDGVESEWNGLATGKMYHKAEELFNKMVSAVFGANPSGQKQEAFYERLLDIVEKVSTFRDERLEVSIKRMPNTLLVVIDVLALATMLFVILLPIQAWLVGTLAVIAVSAVLSLARFVMTDMDNPFTGAWNVSIQPFRDVLRKI